MATRIFTDASSNLFEEILKSNDLDIYVIPMSLQIGDKEYVCYENGVDAEKMSQEFYEKMKSGLKPKTSLPNPGLLKEKLEEEIGKGNKVIYVSLSSGISGTFQSASIIANEINENLKEEAVAVIDSKTAGLGEGKIAMFAARLAKQGLPFDDIVKETKSYVNKVRSEFTVDSVKYLANTGRISNFKSVIAGTLLIKPLLYGSDEGKIVATSNVHGRKNAIKKLASQVKENIVDENQLVYITHCNCLEDAKALETLLHNEGIKNTKIYFYDLVTGAHVGPGTIALFYDGNNREVKKKSIIDSIFKKKEEK